MSWKSTVALILSLLVSNSIAQTQNIHYLAGYNEYPTQEYGHNIITIDSLSNSVVAIQDPKMNFESCFAGYPDAQGHILYYSNGGELRSTLDSTFYLQLGDSMVRSIFCPKFGMPHPAKASFILDPANKDNLYLIYTGLVEAKISYKASPLYVLKINNYNQNPSIEYKDKIIIQDTLDDFCIIQHGNGRDWWVIAPKFNKEIIYTIFIGKSGITFNATSSGVSEFTEAVCGRESSTQCVASPDGNFIARWNVRCGLKVYNFDRCSGLLSIQGKHNHSVPEIPNWGFGGCAFTSSSRYVIVNNHTHIFRLDLHSLHPTLDTLYILKGNDGVPLHSAVLGPDHKIYYSMVFSSFQIPVLENPEAPKNSIQFNKNGIVLSKIYKSTLPKYINYNLSALISGTCDTITSNTDITDADVIISPNPFKDGIQIILDHKYYGDEIRLLDLQSKICRQQKIDANTIHISTADLTPASYILQIINKGELIYKGAIQKIK